MDLYLGECDCCHDVFGILQLRIDEDGKYVYCDKCCYNDAAGIAATERLSDQGVAQPGLERQFGGLKAAGSNPVILTTF